MRCLTIVIALATASFPRAQGGGATRVLPAEELTTVRVGEVAEVRVDAERHYSLGSAGEALTLVKQAEEKNTTVYVFRGVSPGRQTLVLTPRDPGPDGCVSCVTLHYLIAVVR